MFNTLEKGFLCCVFFWFFKVRFGEERDSGSSEAEDSVAGRSGVSELEGLEGCTHTKDVTLTQSWRFSFSEEEVPL